MITTNENYDLDEIVPKLKEYRVGDVVTVTTCSEKECSSWRWPESCVDGLWR